MRNHTTPKFHELTSQQGKNPSVTPGANPVSAIFNMNSLPVGKDGKFWYYVTAAWIKLHVVVDVATTADGTEAFTNDLQWQLLQSMQMQCPILGQLATHANTRGSTLGNIIQTVGMGYNSIPRTAAVVGVDQELDLYYRFPLSHEFLRKPHETSPWAGFLEGGTIEVKLAPANVMDNHGYSQGDIDIDAANFRCWLEMIPAPEAVIHTPCHWREHETAGGSTRHIITDMGSPDGLQGIDQSKGVGLAALYGLTKGLNGGGVVDVGLDGSYSADEILAYDLPFRDQDRIDVPEAPFAAMYVQMRTTRRTINGSSTPTDLGGFPLTDEANQTNSGGLNAFESLIYPYVTPGNDQETSKFQTVAGAKSINLQFTSTVPTAVAKWLGCYFPQFDEQFAMSLAARIAPNSAGKLVSKTLNKQNGGISGVGKLAYTRQKVS